MNHEPKQEQPPSPAQVLEAIREHIDRTSELFDDYVAAAGDGRGPNLRLAKEYEASAGVMRRRAARPDRTPEQAADELRRADWYEKRATVMRAGGRMPVELRTPQESLGFMNDLRQGTSSSRT